VKGGGWMSNQKKHSQQNYTPDHLGEKNGPSESNKGRKMADKTGQQPDVIQTKGE